MTSAFNFRNTLGFLQAGCSFAFPSKITHPYSVFLASFKHFTESQGFACAFPKGGTDGERGSRVVLRHDLKEYLRPSELVQKGLESVGRLFRLLALTIKI